MFVGLHVFMKHYRLCSTAVALCGASLLSAQNPAVSQASVPALVQDAVKYQLEDFHHTSWALRYRVHHVTDREDTIRELVETTDGNVARTLERHGQRLSPE